MCPVRGEDSAGLHGILRFYAQKRPIVRHTIFNGLASQYHGVIGTSFNGLGGLPGVIREQAYGLIQFTTEYVRVIVHGQGYRAMPRKLLRGFGMHAGGGEARDKLMPQSVKIKSLAVKFIRQSGGIQISLEHVRGITVIEF